MVRTKERQIPLASIDLRDETFRISFGRPVEALRESIRAVGVLNPPVVRELDRKGRYQVVLGFQRVGACRALGQKEILCRVLVSGLKEQEMLLMGVHDAVASRRLNPIEIARALERLGKFFTRGQLIEKYLPVLGLGASGEVYTRYVQLLRLSKSLRLAVAREELAMSVGGEFLRIAPAERRALFDLFQQLRLGVNLQKEFFSLCFESSRRDKISIMQLVQGSALRGILKNAKLSVPQKAALVRDYLKRLRYPRLSEKERQFQSVVKRLGLAPGTALHAPPYFEGTMYRMELRFETYAELRDRLAKLQESVAQRLMEEDFE